MMNEINSINMLNQKADISATQNRYTPEELRNIKKACADFESIFAYQLLKTMRETIPKSNLTENSAGKDTYTMLMDQKLAQELSNKGNGLGLQKMLFDQLTTAYRGTAQNEEGTK